MAYVFKKYPPDINQGGSVWSCTDGPTREGVIVYSVITPILCLIAICGNSLSLLVLSSKELKGSTFVYLSVLAFADLMNSILLCLSGLSSGILFSDNWPIYDTLFGLPLAGIFNTVNILATIMVTIDRLMCLYNPYCQQKPKFCHSSVARKVMVGCAIFAVILNLPTFFIFNSDNSGQLTTTDFFYSSTYKVYNWAKFVFLGVIPTIILMVGNTYLILFLKRAVKIGKNCFPSNKKRIKLVNMTVLLVLVVFIFLISEIPSLLTSRSSAATYFFEPVKREDASNSKGLEIVRQISTILSALGLAAHFFVYYLVCPPFNKILFKILNRKRRIKKSKSVQMKVFVIEKSKLKTINGVLSINIINDEQEHEEKDGDEGYDEEEDNGNNEDAEKSEDSTKDNKRFTVMSMLPELSTV